MPDSGRASKPRCDDDLNTPAALAELAAHRRRGAQGRSRRDERARLKGELLGAGLALGLLQQDPAAWFARGAAGDDDARIQALIDERSAAKKARDFARADAIRDQLAREGMLLEDTRAGRALARREPRWTCSLPTRSERLNATAPDHRQRAQARSREEFAFFGDWSERYQYLIDLGRKLPTFPTNGRPRSTACTAASRWCGSSPRATRDGSTSTRSATRPSSPG